MDILVFLPLWSCEHNLMAFSPPIRSILLLSEIAIFMSFHTSKSYKSWYFICWISNGWIYFCDFVSCLYRNTTFFYFAFTFCSDYLFEIVCKVIFFFFLNSFMISWISFCIFYVLIWFAQKSLCLKIVIHTDRDLPHWSCVFFTSLGFKLFRSLNKLIY